MEAEVIELLNEKGEKEEFHIIATFGLDENSYAALLPVEEDEDIFIFRLEEDDSGETILIGIEDKNELNDAIDAYEELSSENLQ